MRSLQLLFINALTLIIGLGLMSGSFSQRDAQAAREETVPTIQVQKLGNFRGQYLTALYSVGTRPILSTDSSQVTLTEVKEARTVFVSADFVSFPTLKLTKEGIRPGYNLVVFVLSPEPNYNWVNADGSVPRITQDAGMAASANHRATLIRSFSKPEIESLQVAQGLENALIITLQ